VPYLPLVQALAIRIDALLIGYDERRSPWIVYWSNVLLLVVAWPLLGLKWAVIDAAALEAPRGCAPSESGHADTESVELGAAILVTCTVLSLVLGYYTCVDQRVGADASLGRVLAKQQARGGSAGSTLAGPTALGPNPVPSINDRI
jgi:hypothetical protein